MCVVGKIEYTEFKCKDGSGRTRFASTIIGVQRFSCEKEVRMSRGMMQHNFIVQNIVNCNIQIQLQMCLFAKRTEGSLGYLPSFQIVQVICFLHFC